MALSYRMSWIFILFGSITSFADSLKKSYSDKTDAWRLPSIPSNARSSADSAFASYQARRGQVPQRPVQDQPQLKPSRHYDYFMNFVHSSAPGFLSHPIITPSKPGKGSSLHTPQWLIPMQRPSNREPHLPIYIKKTQHHYQRGKVFFSKTRYSKGSSSPEHSDEDMRSTQSGNGQPQSHVWFSSEQEWPVGG